MKWDVKIRHTEAEEWISLELGDENPYITLQAFDVSEPSARNVTFSQALTLPVTETNIRAMQYFNGINGRYGDISTHAWPCLLLCDGQKFTEEDMLLYVDSMSGGEINCQIIGANKDLFVSMDDTPMSAIKLNRAVDITQIRTFSQATGEYGTVNGLYLLSQNDIEPGVVSNADTLSQAVDVGNVFPALSVPSVLSAIMKYHGWNTEYDNSSGLDKHIIPCVSLKQSGNFTYEMTGGVQATIGIQRRKIVKVPISLKPDSSGRSGYSGTSDEIRLHYKPTYFALDMQKCDVVVSVKPGAPINYPYTPDSTITALQVVANITDNSGNVIVSKPLKGYQYDDINNNYWLPDIAAGQTHLLYTENPFTINAGEQLRFSFTFQSYERFDSTNTSLIRMPIDIDLSVKFTSNPDSETDYGSITIGASANLFDCMNFDTQGDFVRAVIQTFALFPVFDYRTKTVTFETFQTVIDNKNAGNVMDWSDKLLQDDELEFSYQPDNFAKINEINFKEENDYQTGWTFRMYSASLEQGPEEYMEIPFASAKNLTFDTYGQVVNLPLYEVSQQDSGISRTWKGSDTPYLLQALLPFSKTIQQGTVSAARNVYTGNFYTKNIKQNFDALTNAIAFPTVLRASFDLSLLDIYMIDFMKPVWLEQFSAYFYLLKVENYSGEIVTCEMIKLQ
jgi:hypothetical protein